jgi:hypothetical protein
MSYKIIIDIAFVVFGCSEKMLYRDKSVVLIHSRLNVLHVLIADIGG